MNNEMISALFELKDEKYADFQRRIINNIPPESIIGVRTPKLRELAKIYNVGDAPHTYFEENQIHAFSICLEKDFERCIGRLEAFLPFIDNWATCDQLSPKIFKKNRAKLVPYIDKWLKSNDTYTMRFAVGMLMEHFLDEDFDSVYLDKAADVRSDEYYVNMMVAWFFATALTKQYDSAVSYIETNRLDIWTHNKAIQKARESFRISDERKEYLNSLKRK